MFSSSLSAIHSTFKMFHVKRWKLFANRSPLLFFFRTIKLDNKAIDTVMTSGIFPHFVFIAAIGAMLIVVVWIATVVFDFSRGSSGRRLRCRNCGFDLQGSRPACCPECHSVFPADSRRALRLQRQGRCGACGYDLRSSKKDRCPECGAVKPGQKN